MDQAIKDIINIQKSASYIKYVDYHKDNIFAITKTSRLELPHSDYLSWILNPNRVGLGFFPVVQLIKTLLLCKERPINKNARIDENLLLKLSFCEDGFIQDVKVQREKEHIDILLEVVTKDKTLPIVIENKVNSSENGKNNDQTNVYFNYAEKAFLDEDGFYKPVYVYLLPKYNQSIPKNANFIVVTYQDLVDYVLEPILYKTKDDNKRSIMVNYLQSLSYQTDNEKGEAIMAISSEEKDIIEQFIKKNKNLIQSVLAALVDNGEEDVEEMRKAINTFTSGMKDYTKYKFNGKEYTKNRLVLSVFTQFVEDMKLKNPNLSIADLEKEIDNSIQRTMNVFKNINDISDKYKGIGGTPRYFIDEPIALPSGEVILVTNQWGKEAAEKFIEWARSKGFQIEAA